MSDELPSPPPGITLMSPQEFLDRVPFIHCNKCFTWEDCKEKRICLRGYGMPAASGPVSAPSETPRTNAAILNIGRWWPDDGEPKRLTTNRHDGYGEEDAVTAEFARQLERDLILALDNTEKDDKEIERLHNEIAALKSKK